MLKAKKNLDIKSFMNDSKCCKKFQHKKDQFNAPK